MTCGTRGLVTMQKANILWMKSKSSRVSYFLDKTKPLKIVEGAWVFKALDYSNAIQVNINSGSLLFSYFFSQWRSERLTSIILSRSEDYCKARSL